MEPFEKIPQAQLIEFSGEHLYYEIRMLYGVSDTLKKGTSNIYIYNALLESFVVHASIILDFFYKPQLKKDDAKASHYMADVKKWMAVLPQQDKDFLEFYQKRNKRVMHLSYQRLEVNPEEKKWDSLKITKRIRKIVKLFLDHANPELLHPKMYELKIGQYKNQDF